MSATDIKIPGLLKVHKPWHSQKERGKSNGDTRSKHDYTPLPTMEGTSRDSGLGSCYVIDEEALTPTHRRKIEKWDSSQTVPPPSDDTSSDDDEDNSSGDEKTPRSKKSHKRGVSSGAAVDSSFTSAATDKPSRRRVVTANAAKTAASDGKSWGAEPSAGLGSLPGGIAAVVARSLDEASASSSASSSSPISSSTDRADEDGESPEVVVVTSSGRTEPEVLDEQPPNRYFSPTELVRNRNEPENESLAKGQNRILNLSRAMGAVSIDIDAKKKLNNPFSAETPLSSTLSSDCSMPYVNGMGKTAGSGSLNGLTSMSVPWEPLKCIFLFCYLATAGISNWAVLAYTHDKVPREPLPDIIFSLVPEQAWAAQFGDYMVTCCLVSLIILVIFHSRRLVIARRVIFIAGTLYAMRSLTLLVTQLPPGYENNMMRCRPAVNSSLQIFLQRLGEQTIRLGFQEKTSMLCGDLLFSGHTLVMITCTLSVAYYLPRKWSALQWIVHVFSIFGMLCMVISRTHYTIDIVIAYWLSNFVFRMYHALTEADLYGDRRQSILYSWWPSIIVSWLEENIVPGTVKNRFELPFHELFRDLRRKNQHKQIASSCTSSTLHVAT